MALDRASGSSSGPFFTEQALGPYLRGVRRHWRLVLLITLLAAAVAAYTVHSIGKKYQTSASILVTALPSDDPSVTSIGAVIQSEDPTRPVQTAASLVDTPQAATGAARVLGHGSTPSGVLDAITVTPRGSADVLAVTATASSPSQAAAVANAFANSAIAYRAALIQKNIAIELAALKTDLALLPANTATNTATSSAEAQSIATTISELKSIQRPGLDPSLSVSELAQPPGGPTGTPAYLIILLACFGGLALGSLAALGLDAFGGPVRDTEELTSLYPIPVLAGVPTMRRRRVSGSLPPWAFSAPAFEQMRLLRVQLSSNGGAVIMVTSASAGDGKTTVAAALAAAFAEVGDDVIMMDLDLRRPQLVKLLQAEGPSDGEDEAEQDLKGLLTVPELPGVKILPTRAGADMTGFERLVRGLPRLLADARRHARWVIIDTPPIGAVSDALRLAPLCETTLFVARPRHTDRRRITRARDLLSRAGVEPAGFVIVGLDAASTEYDYSYAVEAPEPVNGAASARFGTRRGVAKGQSS
jgi:Mrp family chromosome partitioning ATPase/capsular polysaccharide biosynthesis protein